MKVSRTVADLSFTHSWVANAQLIGWSGGVHPIKHVGPKKPSRAVANPIYGPLVCNNSSKVCGLAWILVLTGPNHQVSLTTKELRDGFCLSVFGLPCRHTAGIPIIVGTLQVVRSNKVVRRIPTESNGTPTMDLEHFNVVSKWCMCVLVVTVYSKIRMIIIFVVIITI